jgi:hypothetical protein
VLWADALTTLSSTTHSQRTVERRDLIGGRGSSPKRYARNRFLVVGEKTPVDPYFSIR